MTWIVVATPPFRGIERFDAVAAQIEDSTDGLRARWVGTVEDGSLRSVMVWESREHAERFFSEHLAPALARAAGSSGPVEMPASVGFEPVRTYEREGAHST